MTLDLTITLDTVELYGDEIKAQYQLEVDEDWAVVHGVELNEAQLFQYEEGAVTPDEIVEELVYLV